MAGLGLKAGNGHCSIRERIRLARARVRSRALRFLYAAPMNAENSGCGSMGLTELGMKPATRRKPGMARQFTDLDIHAIGRLSGEPQPFDIRTFSGRGLNPTAVAVTLADSLVRRKSAAPG